ncbi:MAG TPA: hypothetical protein VMQ44_03995 [Candidatus Saccharimonadales bacterium]|nr:hypothetical protein [Candidatus Saccharimonadales bacterium]
MKVSTLAFTLVVLACGCAQPPQKTAEGSTKRNSGTAPQKPKLVLTGKVWSSPDIESPGYMVEIKVTNKGDGPIHLDVAHTNFVNSQWETDDYFPHLGDVSLKGGTDDYYTLDIGNAGSNIFSMERWKDHISLVISFSYLAEPIPGVYVAHLPPLDSLQKPAQDDLHSRPITFVKKPYISQYDKNGHVAVR